MKTLTMWTITDNGHLVKELDGTMQLLATKKSANAFIGEYGLIGSTEGLKAEKVTVTLEPHHG